jgi:hypothetical protein
MTSTLILKAVKAYIAFQADFLDYSALLALPVFIDGDDDILEPSYIAITCTGTDEHDILRGVYELGITAAIITIPRTDEGTTVAEKDTLETQLYNILADNDSFVGWSDDENLTSKIFQVREFDMNTEADDEVRASKISFTLTGCKI